MAGSGFDPYAVLQIVATAEQEVVHASFRALALKYHPDRDPGRRAAERMGELNRAYALLRDVRSRAAFDRSRRNLSTAAMAPPAARGGPPARAAGGSVLSFGRYRGWSLRDLARHDPDYLLWLSRHSSGIGYRTEIYGILSSLGVSAR